MQKGLKGFEELTDVRMQVPEIPIISLTKGGRFGINTKACVILEPYKYAKFFYNRDKNIIALKGVKNRDENSRRIKKNKRFKVAQVSCRIFFKRFNIKYVGVQKIVAKWDQENECFYLQLKDHNRG